MNKTIEMLFAIAGIGLSTAALIFTLLNFFGASAPEWTLPAVMFCVTLSSLFNVIHALLNRKE